MKTIKFAAIFLTAILLFPACAAPAEPASDPMEVPVQTEQAVPSVSPEQSARPSTQVSTDVDAPAYAVGGEYTAIARALAGVLDVYISTGQPYPIDIELLAPEYAESYLYFMANQFYAADAVPFEFENFAFDKYVVWDKDFGDELLKRAFGGDFSADEFEPANSVCVSDGKYYVGVGEPAEVELTYTFDTAQDIDPDMPYQFGYSYELTDDDGSIFGTVTAWLKRDDDGFAHIYAVDTDEAFAEYAERNV